MAEQDKGDLLEGHQRPSTNQYIVVTNMVEIADMLMFWLAILSLMEEMATQAMCD
jgi:hypothetical protein